MELSGVWYRLHARDAPADRPTLRAWRWNPAGVPTLYLASRPDLCRLELLRLAERSGFRPDELLPRALTRFRVRLHDVEPVGEAAPEERCRRLAPAAVRRRAEGLVAPSGVGPGRTLAYYPDHRRPESVVRATGTQLKADVSERWTWRRA